MTCALGEGELDSLLSLTAATLELLVATLWVCILMFLVQNMKLTRSTRRVAASGIADLLHNGNENVRHRGRRWRMRVCRWRVFGGGATGRGGRA